MSKHNLLQDLDKWLQDIEKSAEEAATSLPEADKKDKPAKEGPFGAEMTSEVKDKVPNVVDEKKEMPEKGIKGLGNKAKVNEIGTKKAPVGEDPASEKPDKVTSSSNSAVSDKTAKSMLELGNDILAGILKTLEKSAEDEGQVEKTEEQAEDKKEQTEDTKEQAEDKKEKVEKDVAEAEKEAMAFIDQVIKSVPTDALVAEIVKSAEADADNVGDFVEGYTADESAPADEVVPADVASAAPEAEEEAPEDVDADELIEALSEAAVSPEEVTEAAEEQPEALSAIVDALANISSEDETEEAETGSAGEGEEISEEDISALADALAQENTEAEQLTPTANAENRADLDQILDLLKQIE